MKRLVVSAPAKLNLTLAVGALEASGRHAVTTHLLALDLVDRVTIVTEGEGRSTSTEVLLRGSGPAWSADVPTDETNLAVRAARLVLARAGARPRRVVLDLWKEVPSRAGLGGGSADAAAVALGLGRLLGLDPLGRDRPGLLADLAGLGSDVPFALAASETGFGLGTGRGEVVEPLPLPATRRAFVLLTPEAAAPTTAVYAALDRMRAGREADAAASLDTDAFFAGPCGRARALLRNDLERPALLAVPALARVRAGLDAAGLGHFRLTGSGASFFGVFEDEGTARAVLAGEAVAGIARDHGLRLACVVRPRGAGVRVEAD